MTQVRLPQSLKEWRYCIEVLCGTPLTESFVESRIRQLTQLEDKLDRRFLELYGEEHRQQVLTWYRQVQSEGSFSEMAQECSGVEKV